MESEVNNYKDFFNSTSSPANYSTVVANIREFIESHLKCDRRIVLVTVSLQCSCFTDGVSAEVNRDVTYQVLKFLNHYVRALT